ncbi:MAG: VCBS repeat-containing protein [Planctomycetaceae bacterium]|nr:VCBS repeat-containing protein [Planctomycetaceae bacterium]
MNRRFSLWLALSICGLPAAATALDRVPYNHPGLTVDLGVGLWAWPLPMDFDGDGDWDLVVSCPDVPFQGTYLFRNPGGSTFPVFEPPVKIGPGLSSAQISYVAGQPRVLTPGTEWTGFLGSEFRAKQAVYPQTNIHPNKVRANQWRYADYDGDEQVDLIVGVEDWTEYGWDDAFDAAGVWTRGPLHGYVYWLRNTGTTEAPAYAEPVRVQVDGRDLDVFGMPSPNFADFDRDGDLDLLCGEFLDGFTYFTNVGTRRQPKYLPGRRVLVAPGKPLAMDLQMITPTAVDWDRDGDFDLIVGDEDGRVAWIECIDSNPDSPPSFAAPRYFQQQAQDVKFGALVTPVSVDWDGDGDEDLVCGNTAGQIGFIENLDGAPAPRWAAPKLLESEGTPIRIKAGPNGSIQGPAEAKWGYTSLSVADWDHDGRLDIVTNSIWGRIEWYRNLGGPPVRLAAAQPVLVRWPSSPPKPAWNWWNPQPGELVTQWRTRPVVIDLDRDGLHDLVMLDHEGYLAWFRRERIAGDLVLHPGARILTDEQGRPLQWNPNRAGKSGRRQMCFADWDADGKLDLILDGKNADFWQNVSTPERPWAFTNRGPISDHRLAGHTTSPTTIDWNGDGRREILIGAEDGFLYRVPRPQE